MSNGLELPQGDVEFVPAAHVHACRERIHLARERAGERAGAAPGAFDAAYWEHWFQTNAEEVLRAFPNVTVSLGYAVRYRCYGQFGRDVRVRPFVARARTPVDSVRRILPWHPPPDSMSVQERAAPTQDVQLLYSHFSFPRTAEGYFDFWMVMQELWASARWAYSTIVATAQDWAQLTAAEGWQVLQPVERYEPAVIRQEERVLLAVLMYCPLQRCEVTLQRIEIDAQQALHYDEPILVAAGPRGYIL